jgi:hypothetical protein
MKQPSKKKPRTGRTPDVLRKGGPMDDKTKYDRKRRPDESARDWARRMDKMSDELTEEEKESRRWDYYSEMRDFERLPKKFA